MLSQQDQAVIEEAFTDRSDLKKRLYSALEQSPQHLPLFRDVSSYILDVKKWHASLVSNPIEPDAKKRKLDVRTSVANGAGEGSWTNSSTQACWRAADVSFSIPQRKKLTVEVVPSPHGPQGGGIRAVAAQGGAVEFGISWSDVEQVFCVPVPEKAKKQHNFIVVPKSGDGVSPVPEGTTAQEPMVWTFVEATGKDVKEGEDPGPTAMAAEISKHLSPHGKSVVFPKESQFVSSIPESHRKAEKAYHVKAFRGSKEGYLFFTSVGILFGFKKPLAYFPFHIISSISYTSVLQRTFNLNIGVAAGDDASESQEIEFSMLDQADYSGIDAYVKKHGLNDASMAAARKAKRLNINGPSKAKADGGASANGEPVVMDEDGDETELQKAERQLEDEEDEEEEDYDPGSEDDSDGSGSESGEEEGESYEGGGDEHYDDDEELEDGEGEESEL